MYQELATPDPSEEDEEVSPSFFSSRVVKRMVIIGIVILVACIIAIVLAFTIPNSNNNNEGIPPHPRSTSSDTYAKHTLDTYTPASLDTYAQTTISDKVVVICGYVAAHDLHELCESKKEVHCGALLGLEEVKPTENICETSLGDQYIVQFNDLKGHCWESEIKVSGLTSDGKWIVNCL